MSLEMEQLHPEPTTVRYPQKLSLVDQMFLLARLYMESYPRITSFLGFIIFVFSIYAAVVYSKPPLKRNQLAHEYKDIDRTYNWKLAQMDHWCLFGDDDACSCEDFTEPISREEQPGWLEAHEANKERIETDEYGIARYGMVFIGDDLVENLNGYAYNEPIKSSKEINDYFKNVFTYEGEDSNINSVALGINEDSAANVLWRIEHGELPENLDANIFWLMLGSSDLSRGGCSEEAVVLAILRVAEEIHTKFPQAVVVIQGILPRTSREDGTLEPRSVHQKLLGKHHNEKYYANMAQHAFLLWPSIQAVNTELAKFCEEHEYFVYFDAAALFLEDYKDPSIGKTHKIIKKYMPDYVHPSPAGWEMLGTAIEQEYNRIVLDEDEENEIVEKEDDD